ncbi:MAG: tRNA (adenine-N1)-methyltransferase [Conexivisphaerales archaeon]|jgi:tRNA (adenine57-N1/adenine58-N1)-methyltransferase
MTAIKEGDYILLYSRKGKNWLIKASAKGDFHTHLGRIPFAGVVGNEFGCSVLSDTGQPFYVLKPTVEDFLMKCERQTQIVYPKDMGLMAIKTGIGPGAKVVETGTWSGALTTYVASLVRPGGKVYSYEIREDFHKMATKNLAKAGLSDFVELKLADASKGFEETDSDAVIIDLGDPWNFVDIAWKALKPSGGFAGITPTTNQAELLVDKLKRAGFTRTECFEILFRKMEARIGMTRPSTRMIGHTAYIVTATRLLEKEEPAAEAEPETEADEEEAPEE